MKGLIELGWFDPIAGGPMEATKRTQESLEARVRETPLIDRLEQSQKRIGAMCSERRGPRMSIPVEHTDDDFFICTTLRDAKSTFDQAREALKRAQRALLLCEKCIPEKHYMNHGCYTQEHARMSIQEIGDVLTAMEAAYE